MTCDPLILQMIDDDCYAEWPSPGVKKAVGLLVVILDFLLPLIILIFCYGRIVWSLQHSATTGCNSGYSSGKDKIQTARTNVIKTLLIIVIFFLLCFSYSYGLYLAFYFGYEVDWDGPQYKLSSAMLLMNCTVNPYIYLCNYKDFQKALRGLFCWKRQRNQYYESEPQSVSTIT